MWETCDGQRAEAGMTVMTFTFVPLDSAGSLQALGGREVMIYSPGQLGPQAINTSAFGVSDALQLSFHALLCLDTRLIQPAMHRAGNGL